MIRSLLGLLAPDILRAITEAELSADVAEWNEARAIGERDEARSFADAARAQQLATEAERVYDSVRMTRVEREIETLRSEAASASEDSEELAELRTHLEAANVDLGRAEIRIGQLERERDELQRRLNERVSDDAVNNANAYGDAAIADLNAARVRIRDLETQLDARADVVPVETEPCAWCLGPDASCATTAVDGTPIRLCRAHWTATYPHTNDIRARVAARAA